MMELWWKMLRVALENSSNGRSSLAWMFIAILVALTAVLLALNPVLSHLNRQTSFALGRFDCGSMTSARAGARASATAEALRRAAGDYGEQKADWTLRDSRIAIVPILVSGICRLSDQAAVTGSTKLRSLFLTLPTRTLTGQQVISSDG
jgi:hypothetical protein